MKRVLSLFICLLTMFLVSCGSGGLFHKHEWLSATCTAPKTCSTCGKTEGEPLGHSWTSATCTAPKTCSTCGLTEGEPRAHTYVKGACKVCGATDEEYVQYHAGAAAVSALFLVQAYCDLHIEHISRAWNYSINWSRYKDYIELSGSRNGIYWFASETGLEQSKVREALESYLKRIGEELDDVNIYVYCGTTAEIAIYIVQYIYKDDLDTIQAILQDAKNELAKMNSKYEDKTDYSLLKMYFAEVQNYFSFCKSPSGSYNSLQTTRSNFQTNTRNYYNQLSITYADLLN